jgi:hypothetical protein
MGHGEDQTAQAFLAAAFDLSRQQPCAAQKRTIQRASVFEPRLEFCRDQYRIAVAPSAMGAMILPIGGPSPSTTANGIVDRGGVD